MAQGKLLGKRAMYKTVKRKYDIWLIRRDQVKREMSLASTFDVANRHLFRMDMGGIRVKIQFFCSVVLLCYFVVLL